MESRFRHIAIAAAILASILFPSCKGRTSKAEAALPLDTIPSLEYVCTNVWQMTSGTTKVAWLPDMAPRNNPLNLFGDVPSEIIDSLGIAEGIPASMSSVLAMVGDTTILFDAGIGQGLVGSLDSLGLSPSDIQLVYISHLHPDHIGGLMKDGQKTFPNAQLWLSRLEYDAWMAMPSDKSGMQKGCLGLYADNLHLFEFGETLPGCVLAVDAAGHTPGHTAFEIPSGDSSCRGFLVVGDIMHGVALQMAHPEYSAHYDQDPALSVQTRTRLVNQANEKGLIMTGMHFPEPGFIW